MSPAIDLNEIFLFAKVVDAGGFSRAARALGLPKSTVSRKVASLEDRLGARLLHRTTRKLRLTDVGEAYYRRCARLAAEIALADADVIAAQAEPQGRLRVTAPVEYWFLGELCADLLAEHPRLELDLELTSRKVDLIEEGYDVALRAGPLADSSLVAHKLRGSRFVLCAAPSYLATRGTPDTAEALADHQCIRFGESRSRTWQLATPGGPVDVAVRGPFSTNSLPAARAAACAGLGIAMLPMSACEDELAAGRLVAVLGGCVDQEDALYAVFPSARQLSRKVRAFVEYLDRALAGAVS